ncbi:Uncharacterized protein HZ326_2385 [Fusarium oxysporum f. sp. albedinis]|nr:Uncharacterized protein HZ326_2385 [Fusarium oxysporum f. sp. albedinis]
MSSVSQTGFGGFEVNFRLPRMGLKFESPAMQCNPSVGILHRASWCLKVSNRLPQEVQCAISWSTSGIRGIPMCGYHSALSSNYHEAYYSL